MGMKRMVGAPWLPRPARRRRRHSVGLGVGLYESWDHPFYRMPKRGQLPDPMVRAGACLHAAQAGRPVGKKSENLNSLEAFPEHRFVRSIPPLNRTTIMRSTFCRL